MAELSITCPVCGNDLHADHEDDLAHNFRDHAAEHGKEMTEDEAKKKVKMMLESKS